MKKLTVLKIGGKVIDDVNHLNKVLKAFAGIPQPKILVHGGGSLASKMAKQLGLKPKMIEGRRITDHESLEVVTMVYAGLINKKIVATLQAAGCNALGLSGADANVIQAEKRHPEPIDYGFVGDITEINTSQLINFLANGLTPVLSAINHDGIGQLLNTNADTMAARIAVALSQDYEVELILAFEKPGVLDHENMLIHKIDFATFEKLKSEGVIIDGMIPKLTNAYYALQLGVKEVKLTSADYITDPEGIPFTRIVESL